MLTHHRLKVYEKALAFGAGAEELCASWGRRHAIVEHFRRAAESFVLNMAEGARLMSGPDKGNTLDYALGSTLECAACLDIASIKGRNWIIGGFLNIDSSTKMSLPESGARGVAHQGYASIW
jgi:four helix bundle protein